MRKLCSNKNDKTLYVEKFNENYANMKTDAAHSHGKVFEDDKNKVWIWSVVEPTLLKYKSEFMKVKKDKILGREEIMLSYPMFSLSASKRLCI